MIDPRRGEPRLFGKYRGKVISNIDPLGLGRLMVDVPAVPGNVLSWALPCVPYAGEGVGFYFMPPEGANVWVEFEGGDPSVPIWTGCFWVEGEMPDENILPEINILKTEGVTFRLNDTPEVGGLSILVTPPFVTEPLEMIFDSAGIRIICTASTIVLTPEGISQTADGTIEITAPEVNVTGNVTVEAEATVDITSPETNITGNVSIEGATEATGDVTVTGMVDFTGDFNVTGAVEIEGNLAVTAVDIALNAAAIEIDAAGLEMSAAGMALNGAIEVDGLVEVTGDLLIDGQQPLVI